MHKYYLWILVLLFTIIGTGCIASEKPTISEGLSAPLEDNDKKQNIDDESFAKAFAENCSAHEGFNFAWDRGYGCDFESQEDVFCSNDGTCGTGWLVEMDILEESTETGSGSAPETASSDVPVCKAGDPIPITTVGPDGQVTIKWVCPPVYPSDEARESANQNDTLQLPIFNWASSATLAHVNSLFEASENLPSLQTYAGEKEEEGKKETDEEPDKKEEGEEDVVIEMWGELCNNSGGTWEYIKTPSGEYWSCTGSSELKDHACFRHDYYTSGTLKCNNVDTNVDNNDPNGPFKTESITGGSRLKGLNPYLLVKDPASCGGESSSLIVGAGSLYESLVVSNNGEEPLYAIGPNHGIVGPNNGVVGDFVSIVSPNSIVERGCKAILIHTSSLSYFGVLEQEMEHGVADETLTVNIRQTTNCRYGPGTIYGIYFTLQPDTEANALGRTERADWFFIELTSYPNAGARCWVWAEGLENNSNLNNLGVISGPSIGGNGSDDGTAGGGAGGGGGLLDSCPPNTKSCGDWEPPEPPQVD